ncbi:MAG: insulinase family protein [Lachnospiraceae bacterium]
MNIKFLYRKEQSLISCNFVIPYGLRSQYGEKRYEFAHLVEHLIFRGHPSLNQYDFMVRLEEMGVNINAATHDNYTELYCRVQKKYLYHVIQLILEAIENFAISYKDFIQEKRIIEIESRQMISCEDKILQLCIDKATEYNKSRNIPRYNTLKAIYNELYALQNWSMVIVGAFEEEMRQTILSRNQNNFIDLKLAYRERILCNKDLYFNKKSGTDQYFVCLHQCDLSTTKTEMKLIKNLLVSGISSILYNQFVAEDGVTYSISFREYHSRESFFAVYFKYETVGFEKLKKQFKTILDTPEYIENLPDYLFLRTKNMTVSEYQLKSENTSSIVNDLIECILEKEEFQSYEMICQQLEEMSVSQLRKKITKVLF